MMRSSSSKESPSMAYPKTLLSIAASAGGLAVFLIIASSLLITQPIGTTVSSYFYGPDHTERFDLDIVNGNGDDVEAFKSNLISRNNSDYGLSSGKCQGGGRLCKDQTSETRDGNEFSQRGRGAGNETSSGVVIEMGSEDLNNVRHEEEGANVNENAENNSINVQKSNTTRTYLADSGCDLYNGKWLYDSTGPLYTNDSCPVLTQMQNCQGNGRPDKEYENWRWKPAQCDLPRFDAKRFLTLMSGKTLAFVGDSVARNQMESLLCILWQVEVPKNRGNRKMQRYYFRSTSTMIVRIWSSWLVHQTSDPFDFAPAGVDKLHLDSPDERFMELIPNFDVIVLSSGHWFAKKSVYILNNEIVGGQLWWPDKAREMKVNNIEAFGISVETVLTAMVKHPNYTGITILRSFSPDHYEGGAWNTGGSCTGKEKPALDRELVENGFTNIMHEKQVTGFNLAIKKQTNKSKAVLMDITKAFSYRRDGHPGPYRSPDPNKVTKRGPDGRPPPQDCLHWCMPGPVDTWNELVFEIIRRDFEARKSNPSR